LSGLYRENGNSHVFIGARTGAGLGNMAMPEVLQQMEQSDVTVHGFRSTFRDWAAEATAYRNHVVEQALAHTIGNAVEAAYRRGDTQKLVRLIRNYPIETVNAATMARGVHRANSCDTTRAPAQLADVVVPMLRGT